MIPPLTQEKHLLTMETYSLGSAAARLCWPRGERVGSALVVNLLWRLPLASGEVVASVVELTLLLRFRRGDSGDVKVGKGDSSRGDGWGRNR